MTKGDGPNLAQSEYRPNHLIMQDRAVGEMGRFWVTSTDTDNSRSTRSPSNRSIDAAKDLIGQVCTCLVSRSDGDFYFVTNFDGSSEMFVNRSVHGKGDFKCISDRLQVSYPLISTAT